MTEAINHPEVELVVVGLPNNLRKDAFIKTAEAGKGILCTKLWEGMPAAQKKCWAVEKAGVFNGYMEGYLILMPKKEKSSMNDPDAQFVGGKGTINVPSWRPDGKLFALVRYEKVN